MRTRLPSRAPLVIDTLVALFAPQASGDPDADPDPLTDLQVIDGPVLTEAGMADDCLLVAPGTPDEPGLVSTMSRGEAPALGRQTYVERCEVTLILSCYSGSTDLAALRGRAAGYLAGIKDRLDAAQVNDPAWDRIYLGNQGAWYPVQTDRGAVVTVGFTVVTEALI